tara:strand:- start:5868 stop:6287 length:420 start_codon:yes stop_codon:yes gene_type:complete
MAHFAKLDDNNIVLTVHVVNNEDCLKNNVEDEATGIAFQTTLTGYDNWKQTSYNTLMNTHWLADNATPSGKDAFRGNFACTSGHYDSVNDMFFQPKTFNSWIKNTTTASWDPPIAKPADYNTVMYDWDEANQSWVVVSS